MLCEDLKHNTYDQTEKELKNLKQNHKQLGKQL